MCGAVDGWHNCMASTAEDKLKKKKKKKRKKKKQAEVEVEMNTSGEIVMAL